jgi:type I restriction enzyme S subunit
MNSIKLKEYLLEITKGTTPTTIGGEFLEDGVNFVKAECLNTGRVIDKKSLSYVSIETHKKLSRSILREDDLLFSIAGHLGKMAIVQSSDLPANTNQAVAILRINKSKADVKFLYYYLSSKNLSSFINGQCAQSVQPNINLAQVGELPIVDFPLDYQIKISSVLSSFDSKIELNNKINVELESMAKTLYDYWFVQFDFPDENGKPYKSSGGKMVWNKDLKREIPKVWEVKKVKEIANTGSGSTPIKSKKEYYIDGNIPWINSGEVNNPFIIEAKKYITKLGLEKSSTKLFKRGTLLMAMYGATAGKVSILDIEACTNQAICTINVHLDLHRNYLKFVLEDLYEYLINLSSGSARDNLSQDRIKELNILTPKVEVVKDFDRIISPVYEKVLNSYRENQKLAELRDWLLPMLMNGQVKVN